MMSFMMIFSAHLILQMSPSMKRNTYKDSEKLLNDGKKFHHKQQKQHNRKKQHNIKLTKHSNEKDLNGEATM